MSVPLVFSIPTSAIEDLHWQDALAGLKASFDLYKINSEPIYRAAAREPDSKAESIEVIEAIRIMLTAAIIPVLIAAIREFAATRKAKTFSVKTAELEITFNGMNSAEIESVLKTALLKNAVKHGTTAKDKDE